MNMELIIFFVLVALIYIGVMQICIKYELVPPAWGIMGIPISIAMVAGIFNLTVW